MTSIADRPAGGGRIRRQPRTASQVVAADEAFGGFQKPNCTFTGRTTGVVMLPIVIEPLAAFPATHAAMDSAVTPCRTPGTPA